MKASILTKHQIKTLTKNIMVNGREGRIEANIRYDDQCGNGHNSFAITGTVYSHPTSTADRFCDMGGCIHDEIEKHFPELKPFIKWHLMSSDEPMHYIANTMYHTRDTGYNGLKAGEYGSFIHTVVANINRNGEESTVYSSGSIYANKQENPNLEKSNVKELAKVDHALAQIKTHLNPHIVKTPCEWSKSEGKEINIEAARSCAIWPDATPEQLRDEVALKARLPALMEQFAHDMEELGFVY